MQFEYKNIYKFYRVFRDKINDEISFRTNSKTSPNEIINPYDLPTFKIIGASEFDVKINFHYSQNSSTTEAFKKVFNFLKGL